MSLFDKLFHSKIKSLEDRLTSCDSEHTKIEKEIQKLKESTKSELLKQHLERVIEEYSNFNFRRGESRGYGYLGSNWDDDLENCLKKQREVKEAIEELIKAVQGQND